MDGKSPRIPTRCVYFVEIDFRTPPRTSEPSILVSNVFTGVGGLRVIYRENVVKWMEMGLTRSLTSESGFVRRRRCR